MERKIGEIFEYNGEWYQCIGNPYNECTDCDFCFESGKACVRQIVGQCSMSNRSDGLSVAFKKLEKVGEPFTSGRRLYQPYKLFDIDNVCGYCFWCVPNYKAKTIAIEIKQNKENMEEKEQCGDNRFEVIEKAKKHLLSSTNIESSKEEMKVLDNFLIRCWQMGWLKQYEGAEESKPTLKSFDLEAAKAGKPVCTRDGRKARIICFDRVGDFPIVALTDDRDYKEEGVNLYDINGKGSNECFDLMMLPEKKEGWVNVYYDNDASSHRGCRYIYNTKERAVKEAGSAYITTIKINWEE